MVVADLCVGHGQLPITKMSPLQGSIYHLQIRENNLAPIQGLTNRLLDDVGRCPTLFSNALSELTRFQKNRPIIMILLIFKKGVDRAKP